MLNGEAIGGLIISLLALAQSFGSYDISVNETVALDVVTHRAPSSSET